ncbi:hypothetical protein KIPB_012067, partial [Kipferlia bialata]|eukprot:g12067.t1
MSNRRGNRGGINQPSKVKVYTSFDDMDLPEDLLRGIVEYGFDAPSAIQARAIVPILQGKDIIAQSQAGTGKTATFGIGCLARVDVAQITPQVLVLSPTRELAVQSRTVMAGIGDFMGVTCHACIGGRAVADDIKALERGTHVVSGTPGRVMHMIKAGALRLNGLKVLVLDEADELLSQGFRDEMLLCRQKCPEGTQCVLVSATVPYEILEVSKQLLT